ncbi:hypothetical protein N9H57_01700 [Flavobacteriaceae bacterium]|nr:hypothetical protein [Flavobacteriaceae bacterium]MDA8947833.1 hypothetical protein [Flavobacteriaceae bacterium]
MTNRFEYINDYSKILELSLYHEYFTTTNLEAVELIPDLETKELIRNYNLILRKKENTFLIFKNNNSNLGSVVFAGPIVLNFMLKFNDLLFLNKTDIPFQYHQKFVLESSATDQNRLHPQTYADESIMESYPENGIIGEVSLELNQNNEFFGFEENDITVEPLRFYARFNSRTVKFRYNFYFSGKGGDFDNYFIFDEVTNTKYTDFSLRTLENGMKVHSFVFPDNIKMNEKYNYKLYLKKEDEFSKSFNKYLPHPTPNNLKYDLEQEAFFLENFIKIN